MHEQTNPDSDGAVRIGICMPPRLQQAATERLNQLGYKKFSPYVQALVRADCGMAPNPALLKAPRKRRNAVAGAANKLAKP